ncbi:MAG: dienelactone hydrolase family protein [Deltaproteobacteria bacterium]|nr:dienelactone hydrolase family protein [Deltaproteobacteria bacterium]
MKASFPSCRALALVLVIAPAILAAQTKAPEPPSGLLEYHEVLTGGAIAADTLPLIVTIHGLGDRPQRFGDEVRDLPFKSRVILPQAPTEYYKGFSWYVSHRHTKDPQVRLDSIRESAARLVRLIEHLARTRPTAGKPLVTGFSQGGLMSFVIAAQYPDLVGKSIPIAGDLPREFVPAKAHKGKALPVIRALHGGQDPVFKASVTTRRVEDLKRLGYDAAIQVFPKTRHSVPAAMRKVWHRLLGTSGD